MSQPSNLFSSLFGESWAAPAQRHMACCAECAERLAPFFEAVLQGDNARIDSIREEICELERQADDLKRAVRLRLPAGTLFSVPRHDLQALLRAQDKIANGARDLTGLVTGRHMRIPGPMQPGLRDCVRCAIDSTRALADIIAGLDGMVGSRFASGNIENALQHIDDLEDSSDAAEKELRNKLFKQERNMDPIDVIFLYQLIDMIGAIAGRAQIAAHRLRIIIAN